MLDDIDRYRVLFLTVPTQKFLSTRKKQSIRTVPTQKFLSIGKKTKYPNCSHPKISKYKKKNKVSELFPPKNVLSVERAMGGYFEGRRV